MSYTGQPFFSSRTNNSNNLTISGGTIIPYVLLRNIGPGTFTSSKYKVGISGLYMFTYSAYHNSTNSSTGFYLNNDLQHKYYGFNSSIFASTYTVFFLLNVNDEVFVQAEEGNLSCINDDNIRSYFYGYKIA